MLHFTRDVLRINEDSWRPDNGPCGCPLMFSYQTCTAYHSIQYNNPGLPKWAELMH